jgi:pseudouridine synthase
MTPESADNGVDSGGVRLQKVLAAAGLGSRRACEELIDDGRVTVNGRVARLGQRIDPEHDVVALDGSQIPTASGLTYVAINKPRGMHSTMSDDRGRPCVGDLVADIGAPLHHVGRLDADSEGLLLLTNDGQVALRLTHPRYEVTKEYRVTISPRLSENDARTMTGGLRLEDGPGRFEQIALVSETSDRSMLDVTVREGRKHFIRRMLETLGYKVLRLKRTRMGVLRLGRLKPGEHRQLATAEVTSLREVLGLKDAPAQTKG